MSPARTPSVAEVRDRATDLGFGAAWAAVRYMPAPAAYTLFEKAADRTWAKRGGGVRQLERNLRRIRPAATDEEIRALSKAGMRSYLRYWCDAFRLPGWSREQTVSTFLPDNDELLSDALATGRGVIVPLPHAGNWDHAGAWACLAHKPLTTVAERLKPESLFDRFVAYREGLGMEILPLGGDGVVRTLARRLQDGGLVCLLADRDLSRTGIEVDFFGETARMPAGPALLAEMTGAVLLPAMVWYSPEACHVRFAEPVEAPADSGSREERVQGRTQGIARAFEAGIAEHPEDWHMLQKLWLADLDQDRLARQRAADAAADGAGETAGDSAQDDLGEGVGA